MKRLLLGAMLVLALTQLSGCANGPIRNWLRGAPCRTAPESSCGVQSHTNFYGDPNCSSCGAPLSYDMYDSGIIIQQNPTTGNIPAPGPGSGS